MIIVFRNFFRNKMINLTLRSVRKFLPDVKVYSINFYKQSSSEYDSQEKLDSSIEQVFVKTAFDSGSNIQDHTDSTKTSGYQNPDNGIYFTEGYNYAFEMFKDVDDKILLLSEDHFFTTGNVLSELLINDYDLAYGPWDHDWDANGSILCLRFNRLKDLFPLPYIRMPVERFLSENLVGKVPINRRYKILHRKHIDYRGDGVYTNSSEEIREKLIEAGIL